MSGATRLSTRSLSADRSVSAQRAAVKSAEWLRFQHPTGGAPALHVFARAADVQSRYGEQSDSRGRWVAAGKGRRRAE